MTEQLLLSQFNQLPEALKQEMLQFFEYLAFKYRLSPVANGQNPPVTTGGKKKQNGKISQTAPRKTPKAGFLKGTFIMSPDFDEPLEDFKEYMP